MALDFTQDGTRKGYLGWNAFTQDYGLAARPAVHIELFIKEHSIPVRKRQNSEIYTVNRLDPANKVSLGFGVIVEGTPDLLQVSISGFTKTPIDSDIQGPNETLIYDGTGRYRPLDATGLPLAACEGLTYTEVVMEYISGQMNLSEGRGGRRKDPDYFISPYGHRYEKPIIAQWDMSALPAFAKKHNFSATLILEK